jgi:type II secretory pathway pseudopilin PulG
VSRLEFSGKRYIGVTLIELAVVLFIISLILGGVLMPLSTRLEQEERKKTSNLLEEIKDSLIGHTLVYGYLPCPDCSDTTSNNCTTTGITANDGLEDGVDAVTYGGAATIASNDRSSANFKVCATNYGNVPWATLGVPEFDSWDNHFFYRVDDEFADMTDGTTGCTNITANVSFCLDSDGDIDVYDETGAAVAQNLPFIILSFGSDDSSTGTSQGENQDGDSTFILRDFSGETDAYDDLMSWVPAATLKYQMITAEKLP